MSSAKGHNGDIRLVCFDLGRVLIRICDNWQHACRVAGIEAQVDGIDEESRRRLWDAVCRNEVGQMDLAGFAEAAAPLLGLSARDVVTILNIYTLGPFDGAAEMLDELTRAGVRTACLSNTNENHWRIMLEDDPAHVELTQRLDHRFASHLIGARKPDPATYAHVEEATGCPGGCILFFDDLPENVEAARQRGWHAYRIDPAADPVPQARRWLRHHRLID